MKYSNEADISYLGLTCEPNTAKITGSVTVTGTLTLGADSRFTEATVTKGTETWGLDKSCLNLSGTKVSCSRVGEVFFETLKPFGYDGMSCENNDSTGGCNCQASINREGGMGILYDDVKKTGKYTKGSDNTLKIGDTLTYSYCVNGSEMTAIPNPDRGTPYKGSIVLTKKPDGTGGTGGSSATGTGGKAGSGGGGTGGVVTSGGSKAGTVAGGTSAVGGSAAGGSSSVPQCTGTSCGKEGPCDIYAAASMPCATAYSMVRVLSKNYTGPLFQVRAGSSSTNNTMSGGTTKDISPGPDGYVTTEMVDAACSGYCTVSKLYDQSGNANHLMRAPKGSTAGGAKGAMDDYESIATKGVVKAGGHESYTLYMNLYEGYRSQVGVPGNKMPVKQEPMGIYLLADGTRKGTACCWDFGNATNTPATGWYFMDAIAFGTTWWGKGAGSGPWFGIDFEGGVWAGGTKVGDPGYGALDKVGPPNTKNPSMDQANFALGFTKVKTTEWAIRVADLAKNNELIEAWKGPLPEGSIAMNHQGGIILGMGGDNSNNSKGTFIEGAMVAGYPTPELEAKVMENIKAVGYAVVAH